MAHHALAATRLAVAARSDQRGVRHGAEARAGAPAGARHLAVRRAARFRGAREVRRARAEALRLAPISRAEARAEIQIAARSSTDTIEM